MIIVYETNPPCPKCKVLIKKLDAAKISYNIINDINIIKEKGLINHFMPLLQIDNSILEYADAVAWIKEYEQNGYTS